MTTTKDDAIEFLEFYEGCLKAFQEEGYTRSEAEPRFRATLSALMVVDAGDGTTYSHAAALQATHHQIAALRTLIPDVDELGFLELAAQKTAYLLGGDQWAAIAADLVDEALGNPPDRPA